MNLNQPIALVTTISDSFFPPPARWGLLDFKIALLASFFLSSSPPRLLASSWSQRALLDLNQGPLESSGHRWTSTDNLPSPVGTAGPEPGTSRSQYALLLDLNRQIECQIECQNICQIECQMEWQIECQNICQIECQIKCQIECQKEWQIECQKICQILVECQIECQKECHGKCQKEWQIECQNAR